MAAPTKLLGQYTAQGVIGAQKGSSPSVQAAPGDDPAEYFDPLTGETVQAPSAREIMESFEEPAGEGEEAPAPRSLVSKDDMASLIQAGKLTGNMRKTDGPEWDEWLIDLSAYPDPNAARRIIVDAAERPNYEAVKNQGGGRFQTIEVKGQRAVIAWPVHRDQDGAPPHLQIFVHHHAVDGNVVRPRATIADSHVRSAEEAAINARLAAAGLAPIAMLTPTASMRGPAVQEAMRQVQQAATTGAPLPPPTAPITAPVNAPGQVHVLQEAARAKQTAAGKLYEQAQQAINDAQLLEAAAQAVASHDELARRLSAEQQEKTEAVAKAEALEDQNDGLTKRLATVEQERDAERERANTEQARAGTLEHELADEKAARATLSEEYDTLATELDNERAEHAKTTAELNKKTAELERETKARQGEEAQRVAAEQAQATAERELEQERQARAAAEAKAKADAEARQAAERERDEMRARMAAMEAELGREREQRQARDAELVTERQTSAELRTNLAVAENTAEGLRSMLEQEQEARKVSEKTARDAMTALRKLSATQAPRESNKPTPGGRKPK